MRVGITGAHGTGKTTLTEALAEELDFWSIQEVARNILWEAGIEDCDYLERNPEFASKMQWRILWAQIEAEEKADAMSENGYISDRTPLDFLAYWYLYKCNKVTLPFMTEEFANICIKTSRQYDLIVFTRPEFEYDSTDPFRLSNPKTQTVVDNTLGGLLESVNDSIPVVEVHGSTEARVNYILAKVSMENLAN